MNARALTSALTKLRSSTKKLLKSLSIAEKEAVGAETATRLSKERLKLAKKTHRSAKRHCKEAYAECSRIRASMELNAKEIAKLEKKIAKKKVKTSGGEKRNGPASRSEPKAQVMRERNTEQPTT